MATAYQYWANVICTDQAKGNAIGAYMDRDSGGSQTFTKALPLRPIGSPSQTPTAWAVFTALNTLGEAMVTSFVAGQYHPAFLLRGCPTQTIDDARAVMTIEHGARAQYEDRGPAFVAEQGYEIIPPEAQ